MEYFGSLSLKLGLNVHDRADGLPDPFGRGLDFAVAQMSVAQGHVNMHTNPTLQPRRSRFTTAFTLLAAPRQ